jgi:hypothetical protein
MVDGGKGIDTLRFDTSGEILDLTGLTGEGGIYRSLEIIDLTGTGNNSLILNIADVSALPEKINLFIKDSRKQLLILGDAGDEVTSTGQDWIIGADQMVYGTLVTPYTHAVIMAELFVDTDITQIIS